MSSKSLVVVMMWIDADSGPAVDRVVEALDGIPIDHEDAAGVGAFAESRVDAGLRQDLASIADEFRDVAGFRPPAPETRTEAGT